jgi:hypothetical protein
MRPDRLATEQAELPSFAGLDGQTACAGRDGAGSQQQGKSKESNGIRLLYCLRSLNPA